MTAMNAKCQMAQRRLLSIKHNPLVAIKALAVHGRFTSESLPSALLVLVFRVPSLLNFQTRWREDSHSQFSTSSLTYFANNVPLHRHLPCRCCRHRCWCLLLREIVKGHESHEALHLKARGGGTDPGEHHNPGLRACF